MVAKNHEKNKRKEEIATAEIQRMLRENEVIQICALVKSTGLSRGYFYSNPNIKKILSHAFEQQRGKNLPEKKTVIFDKAMHKQLKLLEKKYQDAQKELQASKEENKRLRKELIELESNYINDL